MFNPEDYNDKYPTGQDGEPDVAGTGAGMGESEKPAAAEPIAMPNAGVDPGADGSTEPLYRPVEDDAPRPYSPAPRAGSEAPKPPEDEPTRRRRRGKKQAVALVLICAIVGALFGAGGAFVVLKTQQDEQNPSVVIGSNQQNQQSDTGDHIVNAVNANIIYTNALKHTVAVSANVTTNVWGMTTSYPVSGSGFVISADGYILTNYHVIENTTDVTVLFYNKESYPATVIGYDEDSDIAVLKISATGLTPVVLGNSDNMQVGEDIYCVGNPLGELQFTMTEGIISALDRVISTDVVSGLNVFQISAAVNGGNSGGPVYNAAGEVIGVVTAKASGENSSSNVEGLGFAIPINDAVTVATSIIEHGYVTGRAFLGITPRDIPQSVLQYYSWPSGVYVESVISGSCAEKAGVKKGDIITKIEDNEVTSSDELARVLKKYAAGDEAEISVYRSGEHFDLTCVFDEKPADTSTTNPNFSFIP